MGLKDIKLRMQAIEKTAAITLAMHNIALSKIKRSTELYQHANLFVSKLDDILHKANEQNTEASVFITPKPVNRTLFILIASDRGLCGSYHNQLFKQFLADIEKKDTSTFSVLAIGKKAFAFAKKLKAHVLNETIIYNRDDVRTMVFREYAQLIKTIFAEGVYDEVSLYHNHYVNTQSQLPQKTQLLPLQLGDSQAYVEHYMYDEQPLDIIEQTLDIYIESSIFRTVADAKLAEHAARMLAMKSATDNAKEIVSKLSMQYHRARQQEITSELIDVVNGSNL